MPTRPAPELLRSSTKSIYATRHMTTTQACDRNMQVIEVQNLDAEL